MTCLVSTQIDYSTFTFYLSSCEIQLNEEAVNANEKCAVLIEK